MKSTKNTPKPTVDKEIMVSDFSLTKGCIWKFSLSFDTQLKYFFFAHCTENLL